MTKRGLIRNKKAQEVFGMPFSTIFSIFLIAIFIVVAFFAIKYFMNIGKCNEQGMFIDDLRGEIDNAWQSQSSSKTFSRSLPSGIEYVCFVDLSKDASGTAKEIEIYKELKKNADYTANLFFYPQKNSCIKATNVEHVNMNMSNPYCFPVENNKVEIKIEKGFTDSLVKVAR